MPPVRSTRYSVGHYMATKKKLMDSLAEQKANLDKEVKNRHQQVRRLKIKVSFLRDFAVCKILIVASLTHMF